MDGIQNTETQLVDVLCLDSCSVPSVGVVMAAGEIREDVDIEMARILEETGRFKILPVVQVDTLASIGTGVGEVTSGKVDTGATEGAIQFAAENSIDISKVVGTGSNGRVTKGDVQKYLESLGD